MTISGVGNESLPAPRPVSGRDQCSPLGLKQVRGQRDKERDRLLHKCWDVVHLHAAAGSILNDLRTSTDGQACRVAVWTSPEVSGVWRVLNHHVEREPVEKWMVVQRGERIVPRKHNVLRIGDLVREEDIKDFGAPVPLHNQIGRHLPARCVHRGVIRRDERLSHGADVDDLVARPPFQMPRYPSHELELACSWVIDLPGDGNLSEGGAQLGQ
eukprot:2550819-Prymnesium_polylepis.1